MSDDDATSDGDGLRGRTVLLTRAGEGGRIWQTQVRARGGDALLDALQDYRPTSRPEALIAAAADLAGYDWLVLTSVRAVEALVAAAGAGGLRPGGVAVAAVGNATAEAARRVGLAVVLVPERQSAEGLLAAWPLTTAGARVLLPLSALAPSTLPDALAAFGAVPERVEAYTVQPRPPRLEVERALSEGRVHGVVLTSGSTARRFAEVAAAHPPVPVVVAIGQPTAEAATAAGLTVDAVPDHPDPGSVLLTLADALDARLENRP
ncbi:hypothetical protein C8046_02125 [Serinibacter arcticus]|uniref:Uroporphyrinogen-III synthase n=1 Tax=Serinibacter arcticus TaxID=1655435 RepID=A0A2U1ZRT6_9MICO|nr:uroporphyrinogen-III synthase [Serinibacter arcticus]PWD49686.1 hypothetical protein C8046_02125 [Serinibacter arcticus]